MLSPLSRDRRFVVIRFDDKNDLQTLFAIHPPCATHRDYRYGGEVIIIREEGIWRGNKRRLYCVLSNEITRESKSWASFFEQRVFEYNIGMDVIEVNIELRGDSKINVEINIALRGECLIFALNIILFVHESRKWTLGYDRVIFAVNAVSRKEMKFLKLVPNLFSRNYGSFEISFSPLLE